MSKDISLSALKKLRALSGAGVMACRRALEETGGDVKKAQAILKKESAALAEKKAERETKEGTIAAYIHAGGKVAAVAVLSCETDFVARTDDFKKLAHELAMQVAAMNPESIEALLEEDYIRDPRLKIADLIKEVVGKTGENIKIKEFSRFEV